MRKGLIVAAAMVGLFSGCTVKEKTGETETRKIYNRQGEVTGEYQAPVYKERAMTGGEVAGVIIAAPVCILLSPGGGC